MTRDWAIEEIIKALGFEHPMTIWFINTCEQYPNASDEKIADLLNAAIDLARMANGLEEE